MIKTRRLLICAVSAFLVGISQAQIAFVEDADIDMKKVNLAGRKPLYSPARCPRHQLLYPGDQQLDWVCDCAPATLYYPETDACYPAYRQGPCELGQMLVLYKEKIIPECVRNPCNTDGHFMIRDTCYEFGNTKHEGNPCPFKEYTYVLGVNPINLMVDCVKLSVQLETRISLDEAAPPPEYHIELAAKCSRGSRLLAQGKCT
ncbi:uncharacterized protein DMAD_10742 [Drosophila madeirensis]|uniref:DUF4789 domain-containing protein n=1 Tax=Drosophila madeirensis TaxID=30013 RepID=A0AAU9FAT2_DROMD